MSDNVEVGRGLNRIFIGQLLVIVAMILAIIPPAGLFAVVAALVLPMMGLYQAGRVDKGYHTAFVLSVVARVSGLLCRLIGVPVSARLYPRIRGGLPGLHQDRQTVGGGRRLVHGSPGAVCVETRCGLPGGHAPLRPPCANHGREAGWPPAGYTGRCAGERRLLYDFPLSGLQETPGVNGKRGARAPRFPFRRASPARG